MPNAPRNAIAFINLSTTRVLYVPRNLDVRNSILELAYDYGPSLGPTGVWIRTDLIVATGAPPRSSLSADVFGFGWGHLRRSASVVYRDESNQIALLQWYGPAQGWKYRPFWRETPSALDAYAAAGAPMGYAAGPGGARIVYRDDQNGISEFVETARGWEYSRISDNTDAWATAGNPMGYVDAGGTARVVYRDDYNGISELSLAATGWGYSRISDNTDAWATAGNPMGYVDAGGTARVVYRDDYNGISELSLAATGWGYSRISDNTGAWAAAGNPMGYVDAGGKTQVIYCDDGDAVSKLALDSGQWRHDRIA